MVIAAGAPERLGVAEGARLAIDAEPRVDGAGPGRRVLLLGDRPAFELSYWCGTCPFVFERLEGANETLSLDAVQAELNAGLVDLDRGVIEAFGAILPQDTYLPMLLEITPSITRPSGPGDYFSREQVATWGIDAFWGLPLTPRTPYYRTFETAVDADTHLFEFVVPMVPPSWNDAGRVADYRDQLQSSARPTAVAISTLDLCQPAMADMAVDYYAHWGLTHFLLDGHHKLHAAAEAGRPMRLLSLLSVEGSLAHPHDVQRIPELRTRTSAVRPAKHGPPHLD